MSDFRSLKRLDLLWLEKSRKNTLLFTLVPSFYAFEPRAKFFHAYTRFNRVQCFLYSAQFGCCTACCHLSCQWSPNFLNSRWAYSLQTSLINVYFPACGLTGMLSRACSTYVSLQNSTWFQRHHFWLQINSAALKHFLLGWQDNGPVVQWHFRISKHLGKQYWGRSRMVGGKIPSSVSLANRYLKYSKTESTVEKKKEGNIP